MAASESVTNFFNRMRDMGGVVVPDPPKFDLELYIQNYAGRTRFDRLLLIGKCSVPLCVDALKAAVTEAKQGNDIGRYIEAWEHLRLAAPQEPDATKADSWIEVTERQNKTDTLRLEHELKGYRNNLIKESIRMGNEDLGKHFESCGLLNEAADAYGRMRHDVSTPKHIVDFGVHLVSISLQRRDWNMVLSNLGKVIGLQTSDDTHSTMHSRAYTKVVSGIALIGLGHYQEAAKYFIETDYSVPSSEYNHIASANDVATYGGLLALATMDRTDLQEKVLDNASFRSFLEQEPHIRKAVSLFVNGKYSGCLSILESYRNDYMLDIYLQSHVPALYAQIRSKCIVQYCRPFSVCTLASLEDAFGRPNQSIEEELVSMIREGALKARIDGRNKLLVVVQQDSRRLMHEEALQVASKYEEEAKERLRRLNVIAAGLEVVGSKVVPLARQKVDETWYDDSQGVLLEPLR